MPATIYSTATAVSLLTIRSDNRESSLNSADSVVMDVDAFTFDDTTDGTPVDFNQGLTIADAHGIEGDDNLFIRAGSGGDLTIRIGDAAGANKIGFTDSGDAEVASLNSDGKLTVIDLTVTGTKTINSTETVIVADNHLYMNGGYTTTIAQTAGLVANYLPTATATTTAGSGVFAAGVDASSDPTVTTAGAATFAASDLIQISGTANSGENDGLYEVVSHAANLLTIRSTADGVTDQVEDFTDGQFVANVGDTGATIAKVTVSVMRAGTDGIWETGSGSTTGISFVDLAGGGTITMDAAYNGGSAVAVDTGSVAWTGTITSAIMTLDQNSLTTTAPVLDFNFDGTDYTGRPHGILIDYTQAGSYTNAADIYAIFLDGTTNAGAGDLIGIKVSGGFDQGIENAASLVQTGAASFSSTFAHTGSTFDVSATGAVTIDSSGGTIGIGVDDIDQAINIGTAGERITTIGNNVGAAGIALETGAGGLSLDIDGNSTWTLYDLTVTQDEAQTNNSSTAGNSYSWTTGAGANTVSESTADGGAGGAYSVTGGAGGTADFTDTGGAGGTLTFTGGAGGANTEAGNLGFTSFAGAGGSVDLVGGVGGTAKGNNVSGNTTGAGGGVSLTGGVGGDATSAGSNATTAGPGGAIALTGGVGGSNAAGATPSSTGGAGGALSFAGGAGGVPAVGGGTENGGAGGDALLCGGAGGVGNDTTGDGGDVDIKGGAGATDGVVNVGTATTSAVNLGNTAADLTITGLDIHLAAAGEVGINDTPNAATGGITAGEVVYLSAANTVNQADASTEAAAAVWGIAMNTATVGNPVEIAAIPGTVMTTNSDLSGASVGDLVYLSETDNSGLVTTTAPTTSGAVQFEIGRVHTVGGAGTGRIIYQPRFVRVNP